MPRPRIDRARRSVTVPATLHLRRFRGARLANHHLLTWSEGKAAGNALLVTPVSDRAILDALEGLGGRPGNNLGEAAWTERSDPLSDAPDAVARGSRVAISVVLPDGRRRPVEDLLVDVDGRGFVWVLAGNRALIPKWKSGCVVCLQSCPGSKVANARATMRDLEEGRSRFLLSKFAEELGEGARVAVELRLVDRPSPLRGPASRPASRPASGGR